MKCLIIGYGSIAEKHIKALKKIDKNLILHIYTQRNDCKHITFNKLDKIDNNYDYIIICNETFKHYKTLKYIDNKFDKTKILIEKPAFEKFKNFKSKKNMIFVGYNLRFMSLIQYLKKFLRNKPFLHVNVKCGSYLPDWRIRNYTKVYSSKKKEGGGVILDLSHDIDYANYLFGKIKLQKIFKKKISKLKIDSEDFANLSGTVGNKNNFINITLDYFSNIKIRKCKIYFDNFFIIADLNKNLIIKHYKNKKIIKKFKKTNTIYLMHHEILKKKNQFISCNLKQGLHLLKSLEI